MIKVQNLGKCYKDERGENWVIRNFDLKIPDQKFISIVGRSGSGKTTLLKMIGGILKPDQGQVMFGECDVYNLPEKDMARFRSKQGGFVFQDFFLEEDFTVYKNVELALMIGGIKGKKRKMKIKEVLNRVRLLEKENSVVKELSGGEKQRVCIARAIANNPNVILADEPCGNLDWENGLIVMNLLRDLVNEGKTVVLITHNLEDARKTDEIYTLRDGVIINHEMH